MKGFQAWLDRRAQMTFSLFQLWADATVGRLFLSHGCRQLPGYNRFSQQLSFESSANRAAFENGTQDECQSWEARKVDEKSRGERGDGQGVLIPVPFPLMNILLWLFSWSHTQKVKTTAQIPFTYRLHLCSCTVSSSSGALTTPTNSLWQDDSSNSCLLQVPYVCQDLWLHGCPRLGTQPWKLCRLWQVKAKTRDISVFRVIPDITIAS